ncbi:MAG: hypothetical protein WCF85_04600, partial [Rhodospirillaceae bacterium]
MARKIVVIDTSMLCVWLKVPGKDTCGTNDDRWDFPRVDACLQDHESADVQLVMPLAAVIEVGNHIAGTKRYDLARDFAGHLRNAALGVTPWVTFTEQASLWDKDALERLATSWPDLAKTGLSLADTTIK